MKYCTIDDCDRTQYAKTYCRLHYGKHRKLGDVNGQTKWVHRLTNIDVDNREATCSFCGVVRIAISKPGNYRCRNAINARKKIMKYYKKERTDRQGLTCELCGSDKRIAYDHCHKGGHFRGWLCFRCNLALGSLNDDVELLQRMIDYLNKPR